MMLRETLKHEIDTLSESQFSRIAVFVDLLKAQARNWMKTGPFWQNATPAERARDFRTWAVGLPKVGTSLSDEAFNRGSIYE